MTKYLFEQKIKELIRESGRSQAATARLIRHQPDTFNRWVRGLNQIPFDVLSDLCSLWGLSQTQIFELFALAGYKFPTEIHQPESTNSSVEAKAPSNLLQSYSSPSQYIKINIGQYADFMTKLEEADKSIAPLNINGIDYDMPNSIVEPYCIAREIHTYGNNNATYKLIIPNQWVMIWNSFQARWSTGGYEKDGLLAIFGYWEGVLEINTGGSCSGPIQWLDFLLDNRRNDYPAGLRTEYMLGNIPPFCSICNNKEKE